MQPVSQGPRYRLPHVESVWTVPALRGIFYQSLNEAIKDHLCTQPKAPFFEEVVAAALCSDVRLKERQHERTLKVKSSQSIPHSLPHRNHHNSRFHANLLKNQCRLVILAFLRKNVTNVERKDYHCGNHGHQASQCPLCLNSRTPR